jgi:8-oxo-dGTP pyrophosphatase MutT (NUDIX family)
MNNLHTVQMQILRELLFRPNSRFTDLNISKLTNDHFSYHVKTLIDLGYVTKQIDKYNLTSVGKEFANRMDTENTTMEKQPKVSVLIIPHKLVDGVDYYLVQKRQKEPYFGYMGFMSGKMRYGEKVFETAARELMEEMGLEAQFEYRYLLHEMVYDKDGKILEDKFFHVVKAFETKGELLTTTESGNNEWLTKEQFYACKPKYHSEIEIFEWYESGTKEFIEETYFIDTF